MWYQLQVLTTFVFALLNRIEALEARIGILEQQAQQLWTDQGGN